MISEVSPEPPRSIDLLFHEKGQLCHFPHDVKAGPIVGRISRSKIPPPP